jgi:hypothetical protein
MADRAEGGGGVPAKPYSSPFEVDVEVDVSW